MTPIQFYNQRESISDVASRLHAIIETAVDGIITIDEKGVIEFVNPATCKIFGYELAEMLGKNITILMDSPHSEKHDQYVNHYMQTGERKIIGIGREVQGKKKDGRLFPFWLSVSEVKLENRRMFTGIIHDLTEQKKAEEALKRLNYNLEGVIAERTERLSDVVNKLLSTNQQLQHEIQERKAIEHAHLLSQGELKRTQEILQQIVDNYPDGAISVIDKNFNFLFTGGEVHKLLGANGDSVIGKRLFPLVSKTVWEKIEDDLTKVFDGEVIKDYDIPELIKGYNIVIDAFPLKDDNGHISRIAVFSRNISDLKRVEEELREALHKEKELGLLKSRFVSMASHEFRTPLSTILSSASLMLQYTQTEQQDKREKHFNKIKSAVDSLMTILNDFLSVSRLEEGRVEVQFEQFNFPEFCHELMDELQDILKPGQRLMHNFSNNTEMLVYLDKKILKLILINLISNASKYSPDGIDIQCVTEQKGSRFSINIIDKGMGIPDEDKPHLFERFFRASNAVNLKGTGLGLHIVKRYVELLDGYITFKSDLNEGSTFTVSFNL